MIRLFQLPSFEDWDANKRDFKEKIGEFTCVFHPTCWHLNSSITRYECAIACSDVPTNIYVPKVVSWGFECDSTNTALVEKNYTEAVREIHARWMNYMENTYNVSNRVFSTEFISLRSILIAAICASNKKEFLIDDINQLLITIHKRIHVNGELAVLVDLPKSVDIDYLEHIVMREYDHFRINKDHTGIVFVSTANPSQLYFKWEIRNNVVLEVIKEFYNPYIGIFQ